MLRSWRVVLAGAVLLTGCQEGPTAWTPAPGPSATVVDPSVVDPSVVGPGTPGGSAPTATPEPEPTRAVSDLLVTGNTFWGRYIDQRSAGDTSWPFQGLDGLNRESYNAWVSTLECPAVNSEDPFELQETILKFHCKPAYLADAATWFDIFSLANNHSDNQGPEGLQATRRNLDRAGIASFGDPDPEVLDRVCKPIAIEVETAIDTSGWLPIAFCGYHGVFVIPSQHSIDQISEWGDRIPVIAMPHSGLEYVAEPDSIKTDLYRGLIDAGADAVLGDHAHWVQSTEAYRGRLIVYGMGNFIFDQQGDLEVRRSAGIHVRLITEDPNLDAWLDVGRACAVRPGACAQIVRASGLPELDAALRFGVVGTTNPEMITRPASPGQTQAILERMRWSSTMAGLTEPQGPLPR